MKPTCPKCGAAVNEVPEFQGKPLRCKECHAIMPAVELYKTQEDVVEALGRRLAAPEIAKIDAEINHKLTELADSFNLDAEEAEEFVKYVREERDRQEDEKLERLAKLDRGETRHTLSFRIYWLLMDGWNIVVYILGIGLFLWAILAFSQGDWLLALLMLFVGEPLIIYGGTLVVKIASLPFEELAQEEIMDELYRRQSPGFRWRDIGKELPRQPPAEPKIKVVCSHCDAAGLVDPKLAGKAGRCKKCGGMIVVPDKRLGISQSDSEG